MINLNAWQRFPLSTGRVHLQFKGFNLFAGCPCVCVLIFQANLELKENGKMGEGKLADIWANFEYACHLNT